jgi:hypothetical protein
MIGDKAREPKLRKGPNSWPSILPTKSSAIVNTKDVIPVSNPSVLESAMGIRICQRGRGPEVIQFVPRSARKIQEKRK